jgi:hypothetical protein
MYIPVTFFSTQGSCVIATVTSISGTGTITTGSFVSGGFVWDYYKFQNTIDPVSYSSSFVAKFNVLSGSTVQAKLFLVAGGGAGGYGADYDPGGSSDATAGGGGGGGGIVYYNNFPISSGSYDITIGAGGGNPLNGGIQGRPGSNTTFTYNVPYTPFTSSVITAYGGGKGGYIITNDGGGYLCSIVQGTNGGSAGGAVCCNNQNGSNQVITSGFNGFGGLNNANQGNAASGCLATGDFQWKGSGGGGAGTIGALATSTVSNGGDGAQYNLTGTALYYAAGGGGAYGQQFPIRQGTGSDGNGSSGIGNGGQGATLGYAQGTTATNGVLIIAIPKCAAAFSCREFAITGSGAIASFLECNNSFTSSTTLANGFDIVACLKTYSGSITPVVATGATYVALSASCDTAFTSSNSGCTNCNTYAVTSDSNKIAKVTYTPCNESISSVTYLTGTFNLCVSGSDISVATGSASSLGTICSVIGCDISPSNTNTPPCPCQSLFVNVFSGRYDFDYTDCNGVTQRRSSSSSRFCGVPGSIRNGSCAAGSCVGLSISQGGTCCTYP